MSGRAGKAWVFGDNIDTDQLAPGAYLKGSLEELLPHCLEAVDPEFAGKVESGDIVVGGRGFGIGSSREQAAQALQMLGVAAVIAPSFGGIFYRNALNFGLLALVCGQAGEVAQGDRLEVDPQAGKIRNLTWDENYACEPIPAHLLAIIQAGGLVPFLEAQRA
ncbi:MAG: 3-isopropylmalate dehydratase [Hyphomicrobiales bacterium]|nr:3-isopropylmalate dehydratase [Hyphomicrobiales bacterium]